MFSGLFYHEDYLSTQELEEVQQWIKESKDVFKPITKSPNSRQVAHYGYNYAYDRSGVSKADHEIPAKILELVSLERLRDKFPELHCDTEFNQLIVNRYSTGQGIGKHIDHVMQFGPVIVCLTVGCDTTINFSQGATTKPFHVAVGSCYVMSGDARYKWAHQISPMKQGTSARYSLTFRTVSNKRKMESI